LTISRIRRTRVEKGKFCEFRRVCLHKTSYLSGIFIITTVKFKELKINIEVEEIHPTTGIKTLE